MECGTLHCTGGNAKPRYTAQNTYSTHNRKFDNREVQVTGAEQYSGFYFVNLFKKYRSGLCLHKDQTECHRNLVIVRISRIRVGFLKIASEQNIRQVV